MGMRQRVIAVWVGVCLSAGLAFAQPKEQKPKDPKDVAAVKEAYAKARLALSKEEYGIAAREFGVVYSLMQDPLVFYWIAYSNKMAGDCDTALAYYARYLKEANPPEDYKQLANDAIAECKEKLGIKEKPTPGPGEVGAGTGTGTGGETGSEVEVPQLVEKPVKPVEHKRSRWKWTAAWISTGVAAVGGVTFAVYGIKAQNAADKVNDLFTDANGAVRYDGSVAQQYVDYDRDAYTANNYAMTALVISGVAAASAVTFFVLDALDGRAGSSAPAAKTTRVVPVIGDTWVGLGAGREF